MLEREKGIEPSSQAWEARVLPLNHSRLNSQGPQNTRAGKDWQESRNDTFRKYLVEFLPWERKPFDDSIESNRLLGRLLLEPRVRWLTSGGPKGRDVSP